MDLVMDFDPVPVDFWHYDFRWLPEGTLSQPIVARLNAGGELPNFKPAIGVGTPMHPDNIQVRVGGRRWKPRLAASRIASLALAMTQKGRSPRIRFKL
jgi:hypothetical protein